MQPLGARPFQAVASERLAHPPAAPARIHDSRTQQAGVVIPLNTLGTYNFAPALGDRVPFAELLIQTFGR